MAQLRRQIEQFEEKMEQHDAQLAWPEVDAALTRQTARVRLVVCERLGTAADHYAMLDARMQLGVDTPGQEAADLGLINRWNRVPRTPEASGDARQRLLEKTDAIDRRVRDRLQHSQMWMPS